MACTTVCSPVGTVVSHAVAGYKPSCSDNFSSEISSAFTGLSVGKIITASDYNNMKEIVENVMIDRGYSIFHKTGTSRALFLDTLLVDEGYYTSSTTFPDLKTGEIIKASSSADLVGTISALEYFSGYFGTNFTAGETITLSKIRKLESFLKTFADGCHCVQDIQKTDDGDACDCNY